MVDAFDFNVKIPKTRWLVYGLLALNDLIALLSQAGVGKSFLLEQLVLCIITETPFLGRAVRGGDVLLLDQDTPSTTLDRRLLMFHKGCGGEPPKHKLFKLSMEGLSFSDGSLYKAIAEYPSAILVVIDSLHTMVGSLDMNSAKDMSVLAVLKSQYLNENRTIVISHHISEKKEETIDDYMVGSTNALAMFSSTINQNLDTYFILAAKPNKGQKLEELFIRPVVKRTPLSASPMLLYLSEKDGSLKFHYISDYNTDCDSECHRNIVRLFLEDPSDRGAKQVYQGMNMKWGINTVRVVLRQLATAGRLIETVKPPKMFVYSLKKSPVSLSPKDFSDDR